MIKKTLSIIMALCLCIGFASPAWAEETLDGFWRIVDFREQDNGYIPILSEFILLIKQKIYEEAEDFVCGLYFTGGTAWSAIGTSETIVAIKSMKAADLWGNMFQKETDDIFPLFSYSGTQLYELFSTKKINTYFEQNKMIVRSDLLGGWELVLEKYDLNQQPKKETIVPSKYETVARIRWQSGDLSILVRPNDVLSDNEVTRGVIEYPAYINGEGTYTVSLNFMNTSAGYSTGMKYCSIDVVNGEHLHPGWCININSVKLNGKKIVLYAQPFTCSDQYGRATQTHLHNAWYSEIPESARAVGGLHNPSTCPMDLKYPDLQRLQTIEVTFTYCPAH